MSREIDERIVQMKFESGQFEKNVQTSIHSLDELKRGLDFKDATKGLEGIDKASKGLKFDGLTAGIEALNNRFTLLGITALNVMNRISNAVINTGERMVKSLSTDQITAGWTKYADKTTAVATIMSATAKQFDNTAEQMQVVNEQLDKLNWFTDETSYNFTDMVSNIGKFTSNNVKLDDAVTAMQGISNWAAISGQNASAASRAMYNLSQSLAMGKVRVQDWASIEGANMATAQFKDTVIETAVAMGTLIKVGDKVYTLDKKMEVTAATMRDTLSKDWFTNEVLMESLNKYGAATNRLYEIVDETGITTSRLVEYINDYTDGTLDLEAASKALGYTVEHTQEVMEEFQTETMQFGLKAFAAGQEAKTFAEAIDSVKDAVSSGWMQTFEYIFGDYEKAKELWTDVANILYSLFAESGNTRNALLAEWSEWGGRELLLAGFYNILAAVLKIMGKIKKAWRSVFPEQTAKSLLLLTESFYLFTQNLIISDEKAKVLGEAFRGLFLIVDTLRFVLVNAVKSGFSVLQRVLAELNIDLSGFVYRFTSGAEALNKYVKNQTWATTAIEKFGDILVAGIRKIKEFIAMVENFGPVRAVIDAFHATFTSDFQGIGSIITFLGNTFSNFLALLADTPFPKGLNDIKDFFVAFGKMISEELNNIGVDFGAFFDSILPGFESFSETLHTLPNGFREARDTAGDLVKYLGNVIKTIDWSGVVLLGLGVAIVAMVYKIADAVTAVSNSLLAFTNIGKSVQKVTDAWASVLTSVSKVVDSAKFAVYGAAMVEFAFAIGILTASIIALSKVPTDDLMNVSFTIGMLGAVLAGFVYAMSFIKEVPAVAGVLVAYAAAIAVFVHAMNSIDVSDMNAVINKMAVIGIMLGALVGTSYLMGKYVKPITVGTWSLIGIVASVWLMINLLKSIAKEDPKELAMASVVATAMMLALAAISRVITTIAVLEKDQKVVNTTSVMKLIGLVLSLYLLIGVIKRLGKSDPKVITAGILALIPIFASLSILFRSVSSVSKNAGKVGTMMIGLSAALYLLIGVIKKINELSMSEIVKGGAVIIAINNLVFIPLINAAKNSGKNAGKVALMLLGMAGALAIIQLVVKTLGNVDYFSLMKGVAATSILIYSFVPMVAALKDKGNVEVTKQLRNLIIAIGLMGAIVFILSKYTDIYRTIAIALSMSAMILALSESIKIVSKIQKPKIKEFLILASVVAIFGLIIGLLNKQETDPKQALANATALSAFLLAVGAAIRLIPNQTAAQAKNARVAIGSMLEMIAVVGVVMAGLALASRYADPVTSVAIATGMAEVIVAIAYAMRLIPNYTAAQAKNLDAAMTSMTGFIAIMGLLMAGLGLVSTIADPVATLALATGMSAIILAVSAAMNLMSNTEVPDTSALVKMGAFVTVMGVLFAGLTYLTKDFSIQSMLGTATALSELLLSLALSIRIMNDASIDSSVIGIMVVMIGFVTVAGVVLAMLSSITNPESVLPIATAMSLVMLAMAGVVAILAVIPTPDIGTAINAIGAMIILIGGMALLLHALGQLVNGADAMTVLQNGGEVLKQIGIAIGGFVGGIVGGFIGGAAEGVIGSFPSISRSLSEGVAELLPMFDNLKQIPGGALELIATVVGMVAAITAAEFISGLGQIPFIGGLIKSGSETMANDFKAFGEALNAFSESLGDVNVYRVKAAAEAVSALAGVSGDVREGGLMGLLFGRSTTAFAMFAENLPTLGKGLKSFAEETDGIGPETVEAATNAAKMLIELEKSVAPTGGLLNSALFGEQDIGAFGERLQTFGRSLVAFCRIISGETGNGGINQEAVDAAHNAGQMMIDLEKSLPPNGGLIQDLFLGNKDLAGFGLRLRQFANGLVDLGSSCATLDTVGVSRAIWASRQLIELEGSITTTSGGLWGKLFGGESSFKTFGTNLVDLGEGLRMLGSKASVTNFDGISQIMNVITQLGNVGDVEKAIKSLVDKVSGMISSIQKTIQDAYQPTLLTAKQLGEHLVNGIVIGVKNKTKDATNAIGEMAKALVTRFEKEMVIHSPSVKMEHEGEYVVQGVAEGIEKDMSAEEAAEKKAQNIISAFQTIFDKADLKVSLGNAKLEEWNLTGRGAGWQINLKKQLEAKQNELEVAGEKLKASYAKWLALQQAGVDEKTIMEAQVAYLEASNAYRSLQNEIIDLQIDSAESMIDKIDLLDEVRQAEYDHWLSTAEGKNASAAEKTAKEMELSLSQLESLADTTAILRAKHKAIVDEFGEDSTEAQNAYIQVLQSEKKFNEQYDAIMEKQKGSFDTIKDARNAAIKAYSDFMADIAPKLLEMGFTQEQVEQQAKEASGWDKAWSEEIPGGITTEQLEAVRDRSYKEITLVKEELVDIIGGESVDGITAKLEEGLPLAVTKAVKKSGEQAKPAANQAGKDNGEEYLKGFEETLTNGQERIIGQLFSGNQNAWSKRANTALNYGRDLVNSFLEGEEIAGEINSPSKATYRIGMYLVDGMFNAIDQNGNKITDAGSNAVEKVIDAMTPLTQNLASLLQDNIDLDPVITPVLDLDEIIAQSKDIPGILNANRGLDVSSIDIQANRVSASLKKTGTVPDPNNQTGSSGATYNFTQNNYSPKALSRYDIYRQTRNQISQLKGATNKV